VESSEIVAPSSSFLLSKVLSSSLIFAFALSRLPFSPSISVLKAALDCVFSSIRVVACANLGLISPNSALAPSNSFVVVSRFSPVVLRVF